MYAYTGHAQKPSDPMWGSFDAVPPLNVELGGGMAAMYNHRPHLVPRDMPTLHAVDVADGVQSLGFYMCVCTRPAHPERALCALPTLPALHAPF